MPTVEEMRVVMDAETARLHQKLTEADRRMAQFQSQTAARLKAFDGYFRSAGMAAGALGAGLGTSQIAEYANVWTRVTRALTASEDIFGMRLHSSEQLLQFANEARVDLESYAKTYTRTAAAVRDYGMGAKEAQKVTTALSMALKLGGTTATEQASVLLQFSQALNKGKLDGDEFRSVMEAAPVVVQLLADRLKISKGEIIEYSKTGKLTVKELIGAMMDGGASIERVFKAMPATIDEGFAVLKNAVTGYVGRMDSATGASQKFVSILAGVANNIDTVGNSALVLGAGLLTAFGPRMIASVGAFGTATAVAMGPIGMVAAIVGGGAAALQLFGDKIEVSADGMVTLRDTAEAMVRVIGGKLAPLLDDAAALWAVAVDKMTQAMAGVGVSWSDVVGAVRAAVNAMIGLTWTAVASIKAAYDTLPAAIGEAFVDMANGVIATVEGMVRRVAEALNALPGISVPVDVDFGRLNNPLQGSGSAARQAMAEAGRHLGRDFVGEFGKAIGGISDEIAAKAREVAEVRRFAAGTKIEREITIKKGRPPIDHELLEKMTKAADDVAETYKKAMESIGYYVEGVQTEYEKELHKFDELLRKKLISQKQYEDARTNLQVIATQATIEAAEKEMKGTYAVRDAKQKTLELQEKYVAAVKISIEKELHEYEMMLAKREIDEAQFAQMRVMLNERASRQIKEAWEKEHAEIRAMTDSVSGSMAQAFSTFVETGKFSFHDLARSMLVDLAKVIFKVMVLNQLFGETGKGFGLLGAAFSGMGAALGVGGGGATGGWTTTVTPGFAVGGRPDPGMPAWVGERGRELWVPDRPGRIIPNNQLGNLGGGGVGGEINVRIAATPEFHAQIDSRVHGAVASRAPAIVGAAVDATRRNLPSMIGDAQRRRM